jgi:hypothetical protein
MEWKEVALIVVVSALLVLAGTVGEVAARRLLRPGARTRRHFVGIKPTRFDEVLAAEVSADLATDHMMHADVPEENKADGARAMSLLIHTAILRYVYRSEGRE